MSTERLISTAASLLMLIGLAAVGTPIAHADPGGCDPRWQGCTPWVWCDTTGDYLPPYSGYCPVGPPDFPSSPGGDDNDA